MIWMICLQIAEKYAAPLTPASRYKIIRYLHNVGAGITNDRCVSRKAEMTLALRCITHNIGPLIIITAHPIGKSPFN